MFDEFRFTLKEPIRILGEEEHFEILNQKFTVQYVCEYMRDKKCLPNDFIHATLFSSNWFQNQFVPLLLENQCESNYVEKDRSEVVSVNDIPYYLINNHRHFIVTAR